MGYRELAKALRTSPRTAQRRLAEWHESGSGPRVTLSRHGRAGRPALVTTRAELARAIPEIDDA